MTGTSANTTRLAAVTETAWGTTPASPAYKNIRMTGETLNPDKTTVTSNEMRPDRNVSDVIQVARSAAGQISAEMSYASFDDFIASALYSEWVANSIKNGITQKSFTIEKTLRKGPSSNVFSRFAGCVVGGWSMEVNSDQIITTNFDVMGKGVSVATTAASGATYATAGTTDVMSAATDFAALTITGLAQSPTIQSISFNMQNNLRQRRAVGSIDSIGIGEARFEVTGSMNAYFEDEVLLNAFLNHTALGLSFNLGTVSGNKYSVKLPKLKLTTGQLVAQGNDGDLMMNVNYQALYDGTSGATMQIDRAVA